MPLSQFSVGLRNILMFLPGTYGTGLVRNHIMSGVLQELKNQGLSSSVVQNLGSSFDTSLTFFGHNVSIGVMYLVICVTIAVLILTYVLLSCVKRKKFGKV